MISATALSGFATLRTRPAVERDRGAPYCPVAPFAEPEDGDWGRYCRECVEGRERHAELAGDCARDIGGE
jgi:hypothetical protein